MLKETDHKVIIKDIIRYYVEYQQAIDIARNSDSAKLQEKVKESQQFDIELF